MRHLLSTLGMFLAASVSHAAIVQYTAPGGTFDTTTVAVNASASPLNDTGSSGDLQAGATFPNTVFLQQNISSPDAASAVLNNQYFQFSVTPDAGFKFNFTGLTFDAARGGASTPRGWVLRSSLDGFGADIDFDVVPTSLPNLTNYSVAFAGAMFDDVLAETIFRFYGFAPSTGVGMFYDNITLNGSVLPANALVKYSAPGGSFAPTEVTGNVTASDLSDAGSAGDLQAGATFPNTVFLQQNITSPDPASAVLNNQYFEFTVAADAGFEMDLTSLTFDAARGGASTPRGWVLRSSVDGYATDIATEVVATSLPNLSSFNVDLLSASYQDLTAVTFRLYGYGPSTGIGQFFDNIVVNGSVQPIPEPTTLAALGVGALTLALRRRATRKGSGRSSQLA